MTVIGAFFLVATVEYIFNCPLESYAFGISLIQCSALVPATSSLIKYSFQIKANIVKQSTEGVSKYAYWSDFSGNVFYGAQL